MVIEGVVIFNVLKSAKTPQSLQCGRQGPVAAPHHPGHQRARRLWVPKTLSQRILPPTSPGSDSSPAVKGYRIR